MAYWTDWRDVLMMAGEGGGGGREGRVGER